MGSKRDKDDKNGGFDCNGIVEQRDNDLLDEVDRFGGTVGRRVVGFGVLEAGTKDREFTGMRGIFGLGRCKVLKFVQGFRYVGRHGDIAAAANVILGEGYSTEEVGGPINRNGV